MAEKNTESTAVNQLIELVSTANPLPPDPTEDLMFRAERPERRPKTPTPKPLPRGRAPIGTQQNLQTIQPPNSPVNQTIRSMPPGVRITTAPVSPNVSAPLTLDDYKDDDAEVTNPGPATFARPTSQGFATARPSATGSNAAPLAGDPVASRVTKPTLPPPLPTMRSSSPPPVPGTPPFRPSAQATRDFSYPVVPNLPALPPPGTPSMPHPKQMPVVTFHTEHTDIDDSLASILEPKSDLDDRMSSSWMENEIGTQQVPKTPGDWKVIAGKLIGPMVVLVIAGIFIGGYFAFDGDGGKKRKPKATEGQTISMPVVKTDDVKQVEPATEVKPEPATDVKTEPATDVKTDVKAEPAPAAVTPPNLVKAEPAPTAVTPPNLAASVPAPAKTEPAPANTEPAPVAPPAPTGRPTLVDVRIDSNPTGATVTLIDRGKSTFLGTTPMSAAVDAARKYELVFSYENRATVVEALDPSMTKKVSVRLSRAKSGSSSTSTTMVEAPKPAAPKTEASKLAVPNFDKTEAPKPAKPATPAPIEKTEAPKAEKAAATPAAGQGTLMISSKPPCEIVIDGKPTGLTTPQRTIMLPAGAHKITLVNGAEGIKKTVSVQITADKPTKVIQDFMK